MIVQNSSENRPKVFINLNRYLMKKNFKNNFEKYVLSHFRLCLPINTQNSHGTQRIIGKCLRSRRKHIIDARDATFVYTMTQTYVVPNCVFLR